MSYSVKIQKITRPTNTTFYVNVPTAVAEVMQIDKGELFEWTLEDKNTLVLTRQNPRKPRKFRKLGS